MPTMTAIRRRLDTPEERAEFSRWRSRSLVFFAFMVFVMVLVLTHLDQTSGRIRPTSPLPAVNIP